MLGPPVRGDPDCGLRLHGDQVGDHLAEVIVVRSFELVLDDHHVAVPVLSHEVDPEVAGTLLPLNVREGDVDLLRDHVHVLLKPAGEVERLVLPDVTKGKSLNLSDRHNELLGKGIVISRERDA